MPHPVIVGAMLRQEAFAELQRRLPKPGDALRVGGLAGSAPALLVASLAEAFPQRLLAVVTTDPAQADALEADLKALLDGEHVRIFPQRENLPYDPAEPHFEISAQRVEAVEALLTGRARLLVTTARATQELAEIPDRLTELRLSLVRGDRVPPYALARRLEAIGFERTPMVEGIGEYAIRGGILDVFSFGAAGPVRIEFCDDAISSIREFDILDQRSTRELTSLNVLPTDLAAPTGEDAAPTTSQARRSALELLPEDAILIEIPAGGVAPELERSWSQLVHLRQAELGRGGDPAPPDQLFLEPAAAGQLMNRFGRISLHAGSEGDVRFNARPAEPINRDMEKLSSLLRAGAARGEDTLILCDNPGQLERLEEIIGGAERLPPRCSLALGALAAGFVLEAADPPLRLLMDHEIFRRDRRLRRARRFRGTAALENLAQLKPGDLVVHLDHGIGRYLRLEKVSVGGKEIEALALEYAGGELLRLPVERLDLIERWTPERDNAAEPRLHKIGGRAWSTLRRRTERAIENMTGELLELYAARQLARGHAFPQDTRWQKEMESGFLYEDTPDQRQSTLDVKRDMESARPMDRLICGDVGYGKTEIAIRAAFKAVLAGMQVAVLAPTTILVEQHLHTFRQRLAQYPVRIENLSRFRTAREQNAILTALAEGRVDIVIGTHRLLQPDVVFRDLGLLIIDEEQRFGVRHKERFKDIKRDIDVLTLTATPIPRTLHLSLAGLRDLSMIQTPPRDRMPIITHVIPWLDEVIADAIRRELDRGGQVFFVHNRVRTLASVADRVAELVPEANVASAHGQMPASQLDKVMRHFLAGSVQLLVTTAIIENGLDVPTANTLIVDRADQFGLAQLYQLRGRVGRSHHRAYCYLIAPPDLDDEAERRLRVLEHHTDLGAGYAIALRDLELRGGGNILGAAQSGFVHAVGVDTYIRLLEQTVRRMKGDGAQAEHAPPEVSIEGSSLLPDDYVADAAQKLSIYRRISRLQDSAEIPGLTAELRDRFGPPPPETERLLSAANIRVLGTRLGVENVLIRNDEARVSFREGVVPRLSQLRGALHDANVDVEVRRTAPLSLVLRRLGSTPLDRTVAATLQVLLAPEQRAS